MTYRDVAETGTSLQTMSSEIQEDPQEEPREETQQEQDGGELEYIAMRRQQLENRRVILLEFQKFLKNYSSMEGGPDKKEGEEEEESELDRVEKELQSLLDRENKLINAKCLWENQSTDGETIVEIPVTEPHGVTPHWKKKFSGVCILPTVSEQCVNTESSGVVEVENLSLGPALVLCPTCHERVTTEVKRKVTCTSFLLCFLSISVCCVGGCCLLPFILNSLKDACHICPSCHSEIATVTRL